MAAVPVGGFGLRSDRLHSSWRRQLRFIALAEAVRRVVENSLRPTRPDGLSSPPVIFSLEGGRHGPAGTALTPGYGLARRRCCGHDAGFPRSAGACETVGVLGEALRKPLGVSPYIDNSPYRLNLCYILGRPRVRGSGGNTQGKIMEWGAEIPVVSGRPEVPRAPVRESSPIDAFPGFALQSEPHSSRPFGRSSMACPSKSRSSMRIGSSLQLIRPGPARQALRL